MSDEETPVVRPLDSRPFVLIVDDEPTHRAIVTRMVRGIGYQARSCRVGRDALLRPLGNRSVIGRQREPATTDEPHNAMFSDEDVEDWA
jgi:hypothetical protein